jgi:hypothetical protein
MMLQHIGSVLLNSLLNMIMFIVLVLVAAVLCHLIPCLTSPLKNIPGPFLAKFTNLWRVRVYCRFATWETQRPLHARYGSAVRIGPNMVALNDPTLIPIIYNTRGTFLKVCPYDCLA